MIYVFGPSEFGLLFMSLMKLKSIKYESLSYIWVAAKKCSNNDNDTSIYVRHFTHMLVILSYFSVISVLSCGLSSCCLSNDFQKINEGVFRALIKTFFRNGKSVQETIQKFEKHYWKSAVSISTFHKWFKLFCSEHINKQNIRYQKWL